MAKVLATVGGIAIVPGVSKNRRMYTREAIAKAVQRAQARLAEGNAADPITQLTHHDAEDDSTKIIGRLTSLNLEGGGAVRFTAEIADTPDGQKIASLLDTSDGKQPFLKGVSIRGAWRGPVRKVKGPDGGAVETADDLELDGLDYTRQPGVTGAHVDTFAWAKGGQRETHERVMITESVQEAQVTSISETAGDLADTGQPETVREALAVLLGEQVTEKDTPPVHKRGSGLSDSGGRKYADPGYQGDNKQRYDLSTKAKAKAAWSYINQPANAKAYSADQLKRVKTRILKALGGFGVKTAKETAGWSFERYEVTEAVAELYASDGPSRAGSWCVSADNGPIHLSLSCYGMDPAELDVMLKAAACAASNAFKTLDPDMDGDVDVPGATSLDFDHSMESAAPGDQARETASGEAGDHHQDDEDEATATEAAAGGDPATDAGPTTETEAPMPETTQEAAVAQAPAALTKEDIAEAMASALVKAEEARTAADSAKTKAAKKAAKKAAAKANESAPAEPVTESAEDRINRLIDAKVAERLAEATKGSEGEAAPVAETEDDKINRLVEAKLAGLKVELTATGQAGGMVARKGLAAGGEVNEHTARVVPGADGGDMPAPAGKSWDEMHKWTTEEIDRYAGVPLVGYTLGDRAGLLS